MTTILDKSDVKNLEIIKSLDAFLSALDDYCSTDTNSKLSADEIFRKLEITTKIKYIDMDSFHAEDDTSNDPWYFYIYEKGEFRIQVGEKVFGVSGIGLDATGRISADGEWLCNGGISSANNESSCLEDEIGLDRDVLELADEGCVWAKVAQLAIKSIGEKLEKEFEKSSYETFNDYMSAREDEDVEEDEPSP